MTQIAVHVLKMIPVRDSGYGLLQSLRSRHHEKSSLRIVFRHEFVPFLDQCRCAAIVGCDGIVFRRECSPGSLVLIRVHGRHSIIVLAVQLNQHSYIGFRPHSVVASHIIRARETGLYNDLWKYQRLYNLYSKLVQWQNPVKYMSLIWVTL